MMRKDKNGFTIVELLAVIIILVTVGMIIVAILVSTTRAGNKSATTENVRRNGNFAIEQMYKAITYAKNFQGVSVDGVNYNNCVPPTVSPLTPTPTPTQYKYLKIPSFDEGQTVFQCNDSNSTIASVSAAGTFYLADSNMIATCYFICYQQTETAAPRVDIYLNLKAKSQSLFSESQAEIPFQTSVTMRNAGQ
jgi:type II secretory pathway pseudopilin PulG